MIHVYPGMGATSEMYSGIWRRLPDAIFHDWPDFMGEREIPELAQRLRFAHGIEPGDTLIGSSLGGIVACEISNQIEVAELILVGSAVNVSEINPLLGMLWPLVDLVPLDLIGRMAGWMPDALMQMYAESDPAFIRAMTRAMFDWEGLRSRVPVTRIHGMRDLMIPCPSSIKRPVPGGHLIAMTQPEACVRQIENHSFRKALPSEGLSF
jgi:pimeloyl-ACP methyl ester carboxylesterase